MKDEITSPEQITAAEQIEMAPQGLLPGTVNPTPPPKPTPPSLLDFRIGDLLGLQCDWRPAQGLGHVLHISVNRRQTGPFGRATSGQDPTQGALNRTGKFQTSAFWWSARNGRPATCRGPFGHVRFNNPSKARWLCWSVGHVHLQQSKIPTRSRRTHLWSFLYRQNA